MDGAKYDAGTVVERVTTLVSDWAEGAPENLGDVEVGAVAVVYEVKWRNGGSAITYSASDPRPWVQAGMFRAAMLFADSLGSDDSADNANPS